MKNKEIINLIRKTAKYFKCPEEECGFNDGVYLFSEELIDVIGMLEEK